VGRDTATVVVLTSTETMRRPVPDHWIRQGMHAAAPESKGFWLISRPRPAVCTLLKLRADDSPATAPPIARRGHAGPAVGVLRLEPSDLRSGPP
jgi:hypothetical protein